MEPMAESTTQSEVKTDDIASLSDAMEVAARAHKNKKEEADAGDIKHDEFKFKR